MKKVAGCCERRCSDPSTSYRDVHFGGILILVPNPVPISRHTVDVFGYRGTLFRFLFWFFFYFPFISFNIFIQMQTEQIGVCPLVDILQNHYWLDDDHPSPYIRVSLLQFLFSFFLFLLIFYQLKNRNIYI